MSRCLLLNGETTVPTLLRLVHLVLEGWLTAWLFLWRVTEPCRGRGGRIASTASHLVNSGKRPQIVVLIYLSLSLSTVRQYAAVKEVRAHSEKGDAAVPRVVGIVVALPCCGMEAIASVMS